MSDDNTIGLECYDDLEQLKRCLKVSNLEIKLKSGIYYKLHLYVISKHTNIFYDDLIRAQEIISKYDDTIAIKLFIYCYKKKIKVAGDYNDLVDLIQLQLLAIELDMKVLAEYINDRCYTFMNYTMCITTIKKLYDNNFFVLSNKSQNDFSSEIFYLILQENTIPIINSYIANPKITDLLVEYDEKSYLDNLLSMIKEINFVHRYITTGYFEKCYFYEIVTTISDDNENNMIFDSDNIRERTNLRGDTVYCQSWSLTITRDHFTKIINMYRSAHSIHFRYDNKIHEIFYHVADIARELKISCTIPDNLFFRKREFIRYFLIFDFVNELFDTIACKKKISRGKIIHMLKNGHNPF